MSFVKFFMAELKEFRSSTPKILCGSALKEVRAIQKSIIKFGLLNPLVVVQSGKHHMVVDGRKRLAALRRLEFEGLLPRDLLKVPYVIISDAHALSQNVSEDPLPLMSNTEKYEQFLSLRAKGKTFTEIGEAMFASKDFAIKMMSVARLSPMLRQSFFNGTLNLSQANAYSMLPNPLEQDNLLRKIGPFASRAEIIEAIAQSRKYDSGSHSNVVRFNSKAGSNQIAAA